MKKPTLSRRDMLKGSTAVAASAPVRRRSASGGSAGERDHAAADRGGEEGGQGRLLHLDRPAARREDRQGVRGEISRASRCGSSAPAPSACSSASARNMRAASTPSTWSTRPTPPTSSSGSARAFSSPTCRRTSPSIYPAEHKDPDGTVRELPRLGLSVIGYNTSLVKAEDAPKSYADLLDPKWTGKMVKAHPGYSGTIMTATYPDDARSRLGVSREARQAARSCRCSPSADPPKKACARRDGCW